MFLWDQSPHLSGWVHRIAHPDVFCAIHQLVKEFIQDALFYKYPSSIGTNLQVSETKTLIWQASWLSNKPLHIWPMSTPHISTFFSLEKIQPLKKKCNIDPKSTNNNIIIKCNEMQWNTEQNPLCALTAGSRDLPPPLMVFKGAVSPIFLCHFGWPKNIFELLEWSK